MGRQDASSTYGLLAPSPSPAHGPQQAHQQDRRVAAARHRLEDADRRLATMRACLEGMSRGDARYLRLLPHLQILERALFSRRLELDELLRDLRRRATAAARRPSRG